jgi:hypothetical protein
MTDDSWMQNMQYSTQVARMIALSLLLVCAVSISNGEIIDTLEYNTLMNVYDSLGGFCVSPATPPIIRLKSHRQDATM